MRSSRGLAHEPSFLQPRILSRLDAAARVRVGQCSRGRSSLHGRKHEEDELEPAKSHCADRLAQLRSA